jgi:hypothetical protein
MTMADTGFLDSLATQPGAAQPASPDAFGAGGPFMGGRSNAAFLVPTAAKGTSSNLVASTAFVTRFLGNISVSRPGDASVNLNIAAALTTQFFADVVLTMPRTWTLPSTSAVATGQMILIADTVGAVSAGNTLTIAAAVGDNINGVGTFVLNHNFASLLLVVDTLNTAWNVVSTH